MANQKKKKILRFSCVLKVQNPFFLFLNLSQIRKIQLVVHSFSSYHLDCIKQSTKLVLTFPYCNIITFLKWVINYPTLNCLFLIYTLFIILDDLLKVTQNFDDQDIIWRESKMLIEKYRPFFSYDKRKYIEIERKKKKYDRYFLSKNHTCKRWLKS